MKPSLYLKAIVAALAAALGSAYLALNDNVMTAQEWVQMAQVAVVSLSVVYAIPNAPKLKSLDYEYEYQPEPEPVFTNKRKGDHSL